MTYPVFYFIYLIFLTCNVHFHLAILHEIKMHLFYATPYTTGITGSKEMPQTQSYFARENEDGLKRANENRIRYAHAFQQNMTSCDEILFHIRPESYHSCLSA